MYLFGWGEEREREEAGGDHTRLIATCIRSHNILFEIRTLSCQFLLRVLFSLLFVFSTRAFSPSRSFFYNTHLILVPHSFFPPDIRPSCSFAKATVTSSKVRVSLTIPTSLQVRDVPSSPVNKPTSSGANSLAGIHVQRKGDGEDKGDGELFTNPGREREGNGKIERGRVYPGTRRGSWGQIQREP